MKTLTELRLTLDEEERQRIYKWLLEGGGVGEEIELRIDNGKQSFGKFTAKLTKFTPKELSTNL